MLKKRIFLNPAQLLYWLNKLFSMLYFLKNKSTKFLLFALFIMLGFSVKAQTAQKKEKIIADAAAAKTAFIEKDGLLKNLFESAYAYVIFPNVGKGGMGIGAAAGNGVVYEQGKLIGMAKLKQLTVGLQLGGQAYSEVIFFETEDELNRFKENRFEFSAQASAVAVTEGASANVKYKDGVMIFTQQKGGLMYEASIGGQKFKFTELE
jgi:lipid-binding SYLF domain-containing protein